MSPPAPVPIDQRPLLRASGLRLVRDKRPLLDGVDCEIAPGRLTVVLGPNGAGKSTLMRILAGELSPTNGRVEFLGRPLDAWRPRDLARRRAVLPQESSLRFPFTAEEVVRLGRTPHAGRGDPAADLRLPREALVRVGLAGYDRRLFPTLSGGEKQRVHLARALVQIHEDPGDGRLLLLDEPTASLDPAHQHAVLSIAAERAAAGVGVLAILHDFNLALAYADDLIVLRQGRVAAAGPVERTLTPELIEDVFAVSAHLVSLPDSARPQLVLKPREHRTSCLPS